MKPFKPYLVVLYDPYSYLPLASGVFHPNQVPPPEQFETLTKKMLVAAGHPPDTHVLVRITTLMDVWVYGEQHGPAASLA